MIRKALAFILFLSLFKHYDCHVLKVKIEDVFIDFMNYTYVDEETFYVNIDYESETKSSMSMRVDVIKDLPDDLSIKIKVWGRAFGQYTLPTGINLDVKFCQGKAKDFLEPYMTGIGMSCPPKKGTYENAGISTEIIGLPISLIPDIHFLIECEIYSSNIIISKSRSYIYVT